jgi:hypothetical protein
MRHTFQAKRKGIPQRCRLWTTKMVISFTNKIIRRKEDT